MNPLTEVETVELLAVVREHLSPEAELHLDELERRHCVLLVALRMLEMERDGVR